MSKFSTIALIVAGGTGARFGGTTPKQYANFGGKPMILHSIETLSRHPGIDAVAVVIHPDHADLYKNAVGGLGVLAPIHGGRERQDSVRLGLQAIQKYQPQTVLVHDAARPGVTADLIDRLLSAKSKAVIPALAVADTIKKVSGGKVTETLDRAELVRVQTPQCFDYEMLLRLHESADKTHTDDAALCEAAGIEVAIVEGDAKNNKITTREDWEVMERTETRTGSGFDVHAFTAGDHIMLCGVKVAHTQGLEGHSDADVGLHALVDAILGAMAEGDIGQHFPPSDEKWKGADSGKFLTYTRDLLAKKGGKLIHADITIICERPKVGPHREAMRERIAELLLVDVSRISVKATTTEKLGFTGRGEGIAAQALATIALPAN